MGDSRGDTPGERSEAAACASVIFWAAHCVNRIGDVGLDFVGGEGRWRRMARQNERQRWNAFAPSI